jgi:hypothetical protein
MVSGWTCGRTSPRPESRIIRLLVRFLRFVQNHAFKRIAFILPGLPLYCAHCVRITCFPPQTNARGAKVNIFGVVFAVEPRSEQPNDMHARQAAIFGQILDDRVVACLIRYEFHELRHDMAQPVHLPLPRNMAGNAARILDVFVPVEHFPDGFRLWGPLGSTYARRRLENCGADCPRKSLPLACWRECPRPNRARHRCERPERPAAVRWTPSHAGL